MLTTVKRAGQRLANALQSLSTPGARARARLQVRAGAVLLSVGVGLIYLPAGVIVGGVALVAVGLFVVDVGGNP